MSLSPGTRIPSGSKVVIKGPVSEMHMDNCTVHREDRYHDYWRGLVEGGVLGIIAGSLVTACCLALAWSHWGG